MARMPMFSAMDFTTGAMPDTTVIADTPVAPTIQIMEEAVILGAMEVTVAASMAVAKAVATAVVEEDVNFPLNFR